MWRMYLYTITITNPPIFIIYSSFAGGTGSQSAVQFVERDGAIVGSNVSIGAGAPVRAMIDAIGHAANVVMTEQSEDGTCCATTDVL